MHAVPAPRAAACRREGDSSATVIAAEAVTIAVLAPIGGMTAFRDAIGGETTTKAWEAVKKMRRRPSVVVMALGVVSGGYRRDLAAELDAPASRENETQGETTQSIAPLAARNDAKRHLSQHLPDASNSCRPPGRVLFASVIRGAMRTHTPSLPPACLQAPFYVVLSLTKLKKHFAALHISKPCTTTALGDC